MIGCYDFCGHYEWTFAWLERQGGHALVREYWEKAIAADSQRHAAELIGRDGFAGMAKYWGHTLAEESPELGFSITQAPGLFRIDMHACPSVQLIREGGRVEPYPKYCEHCRRLYPPLIEEYGYEVDYYILDFERGRCRMTVRIPPGAKTPDTESYVCGQSPPLRAATLSDRSGETAPESR